MKVALFAGIRVRDLAHAREWYEQLLGEPPTFVPNDVELVWDLSDDQSVYLEEAPDRAGVSLVTLFFLDPADLDPWVDAVSARGIEPVLRETYENGVRKVVYRDPDGNELGVGAMPPE